jgi:hypothetical protein
VKHVKAEKFPRAILNMVDENSQGGFFLVTVNSQGCPEVHYKFDDGITGLCIQNYILIWGQAFQDLNKKQTKQYIAPSSHSDDD